MGYMALYGSGPLQKSRFFWSSFSDFVLMFPIFLAFTFRSCLGSCFTYYYGFLSCYTSSNPLLSLAWDIYLVFLVINRRQSGKWHLD